MLFSERYFARKALLKKADMNRVRDLFQTREVIKQYARDLTNIRHECYVCGAEFCNHDGCCREFHEDYCYRYCPSCGLFLEDIEMD